MWRLERVTYIRVWLVDRGLKTGIDTFSNR